MRICHLIYDDLGNPWLAGGGAVRAREINRRLAAQHQVTQVCGRYPGGATREHIDGVHFLRVGSERSYPRSRLGYMRRAPQMLRALDWDIWIYDFSAFAPLWVPPALRRRGVLLFYHSMGAHALVKHPLTGVFAWLAEQQVLRAFPRIVTISPSVQRRLRSRVPSTVPVDCVLTGVDARYFTLEPLDEPFILFLGRMDVHTKGLDTLVAAFARIASRHPEIRLILAGRGQPGQTQRLRRLIAAARMEHRITLAGPVDEERKCDLLRSCRFFCMPSRYEGWGIAAIEAGAAGKAVVGTRIEGLQDAVVDGETGLLVPPGDPAALAEQMNRLLNDAERRRHLGASGRQRARRFDWDHVAAEQEAVYATALAPQTG